jgi:hypothetical protein
MVIGANGYRAPLFIVLGDLVLKQSNLRKSPYRFRLLSKLIIFYPLNENINLFFTKYNPTIFLFLFYFPIHPVSPRMSEVSRATAVPHPGRVPLCRERGRLWCLARLAEAGS